MSKLDNFERNLATASSANYLAELYGQGAGIDDFAAALPLDARVADIGAGLSDFGHQVAARRPDVTWTNVDVNYDEGRAHPQAELIARAKATAPRNLSFVAASVFELPVERGSQDRVYSYNLVTHLQRIDRNLGRQALTGMVDLLGDGGQLMVGPTNAKMATSERWNTTTLPANATDEEITQAQKLITTSRLAGLYYNAADASGVSLFPARRFNAQGRIVVSDDGGQTVHGLASRRGATMAARLTLGLFH
jgi:ubiquinone/menaquinone biosynthesis C-methylase UbiE